MKKAVIIRYVLMGVLAASIASLVACGKGMDKRPIAKRVTTQDFKVKINALEKALGEEGCQFTTFGDKRNFQCSGLVGTDDIGKLKKVALLHQDWLKTTESIKVSNVNIDELTHDQNQVGASLVKVRKKN